MRAGKLRHLVTINSYSTTLNAAGEAVATYTEGQDELWAEIKPLMGEESRNAQEVIGVVKYQIRLRFASACVKRQDQILWCDPVSGDHTYEVESILNTDMRNIELVLICREIT